MAISKIRPKYVFKCIGVSLLKDQFIELQGQFLALDIAEKFGVVEEFCKKNELSGNDGINGLFSYTKKLIKLYTGKKSEVGIIKSFFELSFSLWSLEKLDRIDIAVNVAKNMIHGGDYGDTSPYLTKAEVNYFRSFESEIVFALRLLENNQSFKVGGTGEPDFILEELKLSIEVKTPASKLGLFQSILKAVQQIEKFGYRGIIILVLDHLVSREMITNTMDELPLDVQEIILSGLPYEKDFKTIAAIAEWVKWSDKIEYSSTIMPIVHSNKLKNNENIISDILGFMSIDDMVNNKLKEMQVEEGFPYEKERLLILNPKIDGRNYFQKRWEKKE